MTARLSFDFGKLRFLAVAGLTLLALSAAAYPLRAGEPKGGQGFQLQPMPKSIVFAVTFSKDGTKIAIACEDKTVAVHDAASGKLLHRLKGHTERVWTAAFAPDGRTIASCSGEYARPEQGGDIKIWDLETGQEKATLSGHSGLVFHIVYSPDGKALLSAGWDGVVYVWDAATLKKKASITDHAGPVRAIVFAPDGKSFATAGFDGEVHFWDAANARRLRTLKAHPDGVQCLSFSPCGRYLATGGRPTGQPGGGEIALWNLTFDSEPARFAALKGKILSLDFSPDGKMLAASGGWFAQYGEVKLFETASAKERIRIQDRKEWVECVKFSPDARILASAGGFTAGTPGEIEFRRLSETAGTQPARRAKMSAEQIQSLWEELADADATTAYQAVQSLADHPDQALTVFKTRLKPAVAPDAERLAKLIAKLGDAKFQERERASKDLEELGDAAAPALRKALAAGQTAEAQRRAALLVRRLEIPITARELVRIIRAVEVLEKIGTNEARELLQSLAKGAPEARLTSEAQDSLKRWK